MSNIKKKRKIGSLIFKIIGTLVLVGILSFSLFCVYFVNYAKSDIAQQSKIVLENYELPETSSVYYKDNSTGKWVEMQRLYSDEDRIWVAYDSIPSDLVFACVSIEDKRFFEHDGVDWLRTMKACANMFIGRSSFGGSTITQQLVKNLTRDDDVTVHRKLTEIYRALQLEKDYPDKSTIMQMYLNVIYLGEHCYGVESAARKYFAKDVWDLSLAECASLIGITNNPSAYDPYIYPENNKHRQELILKAMLDQGYITEQAYNAAVAEQLVFKSASSNTDSSVSGYYSYFTDEVVRDVIADMMSAYEISYREANYRLTSGGYSIYSTMNYEVQSAMEDIFENDDNLPSTQSSQQLQSGMIVIDNATGDIVGIIGGTGKKAGSLVWNRATMSTLQPGSSIKPLTVYAPALENGLITPATIMDDIPSRFTNNGFWPPNSDGRFRGLVNMSTAVAKSLNTVAVSIVDKLTPEASFHFAEERFGITTLVEKTGELTDLTVWGMGMGSLTYGMRIDEMAQAYAAIANSGVYRQGRTYTKVVDRWGNTILDNTQNSYPAVSEKTAWYLTSMMEETVKTGTGTRAAIADISVAGKTGTTDDSKDLWFAGYTPYFTGVIWTGYDYPESISTTDGSGSPAVTLWQMVMSKIHATKDPASFTRPSYIVECTVCADSGLIVSEACQRDPRGNRATTVLLSLEDVPKEICKTHSLVAICGQSGMVATSYCKKKAGSTLTYEGLITVKRYFPIEGIVVEDEQFNYYPSMPAGFFRAQSPVKNQFDLACPIHVEEIESKTLEELIEEALSGGNTN